MEAYVKADEAGIFNAGAQGQAHAPSDRTDSGMMTRPSNASTTKS